MPPSASGNDCRLYPPQTFPGNDLIQGFHVPAFDIAQMVDSLTGAQRAIWIPPANTTVVSCAIFGCAPEFVEFDRGDGQPSYAIRNFDECALSSEVLLASDGQFDVGPPTPAASCSDPERQPGCAGYVLDWLLVGCWAYDGTHIVGATELQPLTPGNGYVTASCMAGSEGEPCRSSANGRVGTCRQGQCAAHCQSPQDCEQPVSMVEVDGGPSDASGDAHADPDAEVDADAGGSAQTAAHSCAFTCEAISGRSDLGTCIPISVDQ